jgi:hypothetical protein
LWRVPLYWQKVWCERQTDIYDIEFDRYQLVLCTHLNKIPESFVILYGVPQIGVMGANHSPPVF